MVWLSVIVMSFLLLGRLAQTLLARCCEGGGPPCQLIEHLPGGLRTDSAFEPSLYQRRSPPSGNAIFQGRDKDPETAPAIQWADCRDKMRARPAAMSGLFALNREISVCVRLRGGVGRTRTSNQAVIVKRWAKHSATIL